MQFLNNIWYWHLLVGGYDKSNGLYVTWFPDGYVPWRIRDD